MPAGVERDYPLARLTTVRAGGAAELFARPASAEAELVELLAWADARAASRSRSSARARTCWSPTTGVRGLVLKLAGELAELERDGERIVCGGGVRLPSAAAKVAGWGLTGLEFGINIPGTVGGAVRMNANAYGGELARVLEWVDVCTAAGVERRAPGAARLRLPALEPARRARSSRAPRSRSAEAEPAAVKATLAEMRGQAPRGAAVRDQDLRLDLQEPRRPARRGPDRRPAARGGRLRGARGRRRAALAQARELRREHRRRDHRRRARGDGRRRAGGSTSASGSCSSPRSRCSASPSGPPDWELDAATAERAGAGPAGRTEPR